MLPWYVWFIAGLVMLIVELMAGTMYLLWAACAAFLAGLAALLLGSVAWLPWVVFSVGTLLLAAVTRPFVHKVRIGRGVASNVDSLIGKEAVVLQRIDHAANTGRVRIGGDEWRARAEDVVEAGARVVVLRVEGATLSVQELG